MRVLVTGATGFTGRHLTELCVRRGAGVIALGRRPGGPPFIEQVERYVQVDLTVPGEAERAITEAAPDRIFHLAGVASVARSWADPLTPMRENYLMTLNLLEAVRVQCPRVPVMVACSSEEYGPPRRLPIVEDDPLRPHNPYAASKTTADVLAAFYADAHDLCVIRTRAFNQAGPGQPDTYVISTLARQIAQAERSGAPDVTVTMGSGEAKRDFVDVRDVARASWSVVEEADATVYNVCAGRSVSIADVLTGLADHTTLEVRRRTDPALLRQNEVMDVVGSHERLSAATGWAPEVELSQTLGDTLDWWRRELG